MSKKCTSDDCIIIYIVKWFPNRTKYLGSNKNWYYNIVIRVIFNYNNI